MKEIAIEKIKPSTTNPRENLGNLTELSKSIISRIKDEKRGLMSPIIVKQLTPEPNDTYEIVIGMRRFEATKLAGLKTITCLIEDYDEEDAIIAGLIENEQRKDLEWYERANVYSKLRGELVKTEGAVKYYERNIEDIIKISAEQGHEITRDIIQNHLLAYEVFNHEPRSSRLDLSIVELIHAFPKEDWKLLIDKTFENSWSLREVENLRKKVKQIRSMIENISDDSIRDKISELIEPVIFEKTVNENTIKILIAKELGVYIPPEPIIEIFDPFLLKFEKLQKSFPDRCEYSESEENDSVLYVFKVRVKKNELEV